MWALALILAGTIAARTPPPSTGLTENLSPAVIALLHKGDQLAHKQDYDGARQAYDQANGKAHHHCEACLFRLADAYHDLGQNGQALDELKQAIKRSPDAAFAALAHQRRGEIRVGMAGYGHPKSNDLKHAVAQFHQALALAPGDASLHFELGLALLRQTNDAAGIQELQLYLATSNPDPKLAAKARIYIASPLRAREPFAPNYRIHTDDGQVFTPSSLQGKVVLLDFWASWCPPCRMSTPAIASLEKKFGRRKDFVLIGVDDDRSRRDWHNYMAAHHMNWPDDYAPHGSVSIPFNVNLLPTFIVLDRNEIVRFRDDGWSDFMGSRIQSAISKALKEKP